MKCSEFEEWFRVNLTGKPPEGWPAEEYRRHAAFCLRCQFLLSTPEVEEAVVDIASRYPPEEGDAELAEAAIRNIHQRARRLRLLKGGAALLGVATLLVGSLAFWPRDQGGSGTGGDSSPSVAVVAGSPEEFARRLADEDFSFVRAAAVQGSGKLLFAFERTSPGADPYEFVKEVVLSGFEEAFPDAPHLTVSVKEGERNWLRVLATREDVAGLRGSSREVPGPAFCSRLKVLHDQEGRAKRAEEDQE